MSKLKIVVVFVFLFFLNSNLIYSQYNFGLKSGLNFANVKGNIDEKTKTSVYLGLYSKIKLNEMFNFQPEIVYSRQGYNLKGISNKLRYNFDYINVPLMFAFKDLENFHLEFGPQFGLLLKSEIKDNLDLKKVTTNFDFGFNIGANAFVTKKLFINLRYNLGFININHEDNTDLNIRNSILSLGVGYDLFKI
ncbi:MAG: porin family protein [Flavobacterium sp.]